MQTVVSAQVRDFFCGRLCHQALKFILHESLHRTMHDASTHDDNVKTAPYFWQVYWLKARELTVIIINERARLVRPVI